MRMQCVPGPSPLEGLGTRLTSDMQMALQPVHALQKCKTVSYSQACLSSANYVLACPVFSVAWLVSLHRCLCGHSQFMLVIVRSL